MPAESQLQERHEFGADVGRLLDLVVNSLYSEREIFLRELVANAADASDRRRFESLTDPKLAPPADAKLRIIPDRTRRTLTIADEGIGMTRDELIANLGTIARSGSRMVDQAIVDASPEERPKLIGQFGVGFYSAFMVADRVSVVSRRAATDEAWCWASEGRGEFTIDRAERATPGTDVCLHLKADADEFLEPYRLETIVRKWADHITVPIVIVRDGRDQPANEGTALWRRPKSELTEQAYAEFYRHLGVRFDKPWATLHWRAEGALNFAALLFVPGSRPFEAIEGNRVSRVRLHVSRMFITEDAGLLPPWLRFIIGVVDTEDLPLNVSREMLQATPVLARIRKAVTSRVLNELKGRTKDAADYAGFWENFGAVLKEGLWETSEHQAELSPLLRFRSSVGEGWVGLSDYVGRMKPEQKAIYFLTGDDTQALRSSPHLEGFRARDIEVLLLSDSIDAFWPERFGEFEGKKLRNAAYGVEDMPPAAPGSAPQEGFDAGALIKALKAALGEQVSDVRPSARLVDSAVVLAPDAAGPDLHLQRLLRRAGRQTPTASPILEINLRHPLIRALAAMQEAGKPIEDPARTLLDLARIRDGDSPADPAAFVQHVTSSLARSLSGNGAAESDAPSC